MSGAENTSKRPREDDIGAGNSAGAKRTRTDETVPIRDEEFWYEDGTVMLVARGVQFRVYKGVLADHSSVFADMFSLPQPPSSPSTSSLPECPVVHLEDSPEDLRHILRALFPKRHAKFIPSEPLKALFNSISAYARLGHKYQMEDLLNQALDFLKRHFTTDFDTWYNHEDYVPEGWQNVHAIAVVNIARLVQCDSLLPSALSVCCVVGGETLLAGFEREDGTGERLSEEDLGLCFTAISKLCQASTNAILAAFLPTNSAADCRSPKACQREVLFFLRSYPGSEDTIAKEHPFVSWNCYVDETKVSFCYPCFEAVRERLYAEQRKIWAQLPEVFGLTVGNWPGRESAVVGEA